MYIKCIEGRCPFHCNAIHEVQPAFQSLFSRAIRWFASPCPLIRMGLGFDAVKWDRFDFSSVLLREDETDDKAHSPRLANVSFSILERSAPLVLGPDLVGIKCFTCIGAGAEPVPYIAFFVASQKIRFCQDCCKYVITYVEKTMEDEKGKDCMRKD